MTALELAPDGSGYRMHTRFAKFINLPELLSMFRTFADVQTADMLNLPRPTVAGGRPQIAAAPASEPLKAFIQTLTKRAEKLRTSRVDPSVDNMLKITGDGRKAALDMRLVEPFGEPEPDTKLTLAVQRIKAVWAETSDARSTQLVFCDLSTPNPASFNVYDEVRTKLIESGVPQAEIAFIHDADSDADKKTLFDDVNAGRIRILIGSTEKMGAGTNVQKRLAALHHLDAPWRPRDIEQREGRILRQGNLNGEVQNIPLRDGRLVRRLYVADPGDQGPLHPAGDERPDIGAQRRGPRRRRADLRRDQGDCLRQSRRDGKGQNRHRNPQARPVARGAPQPAAQHPPANPLAAVRDQGDGRSGSTGLSADIGNPRRPRRRRVLDDGRQASLFRQGRTRGRRGGADARPSCRGATT